MGSCPTVGTGPPPCARPVEGVAWGCRASSLPPAWVSRAWGEAALALDSIRGTHPGGGQGGVPDPLGCL